MLANAENIFSAVHYEVGGTYPAGPSVRAERALSVRRTLTLA
jgi:hypothetical protein